MPHCPPRGGGGGQSFFKGQVALFSGGVCVINAEGAFRLVLPGVNICLPFEEGILRSCIGGLVG